MLGCYYTILYRIDLSVLIRCCLCAAGLIFNYASCWSVDGSESCIQWVYCSYVEYSCQGESLEHIVFINFGKFTANCSDMLAVCKHVL